MKLASCRSPVRERQLLAKAAEAPRCAATGACDGHADHTNTAAEADAATAGSDCAASAACATPAATATSGRASTATAAAVTATASPREQHAAQGLLLGDEMEGGEADVGKFFFTELDHHAG